MENKFTVMVVMRKILNHFFWLCLLMGSAIILPGCALPGVYNHYVASIEGTVIDAETKQPIEGVLVKVSWRTEVGGWAGSVDRESLPPEEALTDANGNYKIEAKGNILADGYIDEGEPYINFFKSGYLAELKNNNYIDEYRSAWYRSSDWNGKTIELTPSPVVDYQYVRAFNDLVSGVDGGGANPCHLARLPLTFKTVESERLRIEELVEQGKYYYDMSQPIWKTAPSALYGHIHRVKKCSEWKNFEKEYSK